MCVLLMTLSKFIVVVYIKGMHARNKWCECDMCPFNKKYKVKKGQLQCMKPRPALHNRPVQKCLAFMGFYSA
jgi:hypothetical protein